MLYGSDVGAVIEQVGRAAVPHDMGAEASCVDIAGKVVLYDAFHQHGIERETAGTHEKVNRWFGCFLQPQLPV